ncbi:MAG: Maf family protein [Eubacteriales bacterium]|jgi:septum formation protein|nr:septum formation inhibitor Maf [Bacillota bacterium]MBV1727007.1 Maf family protein [Desulforudis sp.]MDQ7789870.1 Maf family protein [Clostridia bacterium]MDZ4043772.1 Maf family protein [Eubacteriales bacterium]MBU4534051.1 septum formation inhibitor Maf [Bacillota bacterium]
MHYQLVLASASPRRRELLSNIGLDFIVIPGNIDEPLLDGMSPSEQVEALALAKARFVAGPFSDGVVLGADTIVVLDGRMLGKPANASEAITMLQFLQGREHVVYTGVALVDVSTGRDATLSESTRVHFAPLDRPTIEWYVSTGEPMDKAGAYGVQGLGSMFIEGINGCYFNVVGLPLRRVALMLKEFGIDPFVDRSAAQRR